MSDASRHPRRHSIFSRLTIGAMLVSIALIVLLWAIAHWTIRDAGDVALERAVDVDLAGLADIYASGGENELVRRIGDRIALVPDSDNAPHYLLLGPGDTRLAGDLDRWPPLDARFSETGMIELADGSRVWARATLLGPDTRLLVGREDVATPRLLERVGIGFLVAGILAVIAVAALGKLTGHRLGRRIERLNDAFRHRDPGAIAALAADSYRRDEIDELTGHSASAIEQTLRLASSNRETSDQIAHEIRTPLMHLDNQLVKLGRTTSDAGATEALGDARAEIRNIVALLESLLDIASSEARIGDASGLKPVDLSGTVARIVELYADSAEESGHTFEHAITPGITIPGEEMQLARLVTNLLDNAFKYVPEGETIRVSLTPGPKLEVADTGPGIAEQHRDTVFDRFRRGGKPDNNGSAGLGLALARAIAQRHGLQLRLADSDVGARFVIEKEAAA